MEGDTEGGRGPGTSVEGVHPAFTLGHRGLSPVSSEKHTLNLPLPSWHLSNLQDQGHTSLFWEALTGLAASICIPAAPVLHPHSLGTCMDKDWLAGQPPQ